MSNEPMRMSIKTIENNLTTLAQFCKIQYPGKVSREIRCAYDRLNATSKASDIDEVVDCVSDAKFQIALAISELSQDIRDNYHLETYMGVGAYANLINELAIVLADLEMMFFI